MISFVELFDVILMTAFLGFLFQNYIKPKKTAKDVVDQYINKTNKWKDFLFSCAVLAPAIILHELAHKFTAIYFGLEATFHAFYANSTTLWLGLFALIAKVTNFGFIFLVPGFVTITGTGTNTEFFLIALAGPAMHAIFYVASKILLATKINLSENQRYYLHVFSYINGFLFIFNMIPIPGFDGSKVFYYLGQALF